MTADDPHVHDQRFDGDAPRLVCRGCGALWDALSGLPLNAAAGKPEPAPRTVADPRVVELEAALRALLNHLPQHHHGTDCLVEMEARALLSDADTATPEPGGVG